MIQTCGECGREIDTGGMGAAPMCEHYKWNHPVAFFGDRDAIPPKYRPGGGVHPNPGDQATLADFRGGCA